MNQTTTSPHTDLLTQARAHYTEVTIVFLVIAEIFGLVVIQAAPIDGSSKPLRLGFVIGFILLDLFMFYWLRRGRNPNIPITVVIIKLIVGTIVASAISDYWWFVITASLTVLMTATLAPNLLYLLSNIAILGLTVIRIATHNYGPNVTVQDDSPGIIIFLTLLTLSASVRYFTNTTERAVNAATDSARLLRAAAETGQDLTKTLNLRQILPLSVDLISQRFGFYHVQIFLINEDGTNAQLAASTGEVGQKLFERQHSLPVGSKSVIGTVTSTGRTVIAQDTDPFYYRNQLLPLTRSEMALPIFDGDKIIGALDVQSSKQETFSNEVTQALQTLANQIGTSIRNARLFEAQERSTRDTKRLFLESETNLREIQRLNQQLTRQGWQEYLNTGNFSGVTVDNDQISSTGVWSDTLIKATTTGKPVTDNREGQPVIAVPVMLGNEVIGAIEVEPTGERAPDPDLVEMVQAVAQRLAISLDKARLFEESQQATAREQRINEIVGRYQTVTNVDELLRITLEELSQTLGASHGAIRLGSMSKASLNGNGDGHL